AGIDGSANRAREIIQRGLERAAYADLGQDDGRQHRPQGEGQLEHLRDCQGEHGRNADPQAEPQLCPMLRRPFPKSFPIRREQLNFPAHCHRHFAAATISLGLRGVLGHVKTLSGCERPLGETPRMSADREHPVVERILPISVGEWTRSVTRWDAFAVLLVIGILIFLGEASRSLLAPLSELQATPLSLAPAHLPEYAARTTLRMLVALAFSLFFTFTYATLAAKSRRAELVLVRLLDILQSVPILGFLSITSVFFMSLAPGRVLGAEFAAIFAIFTSQAWNMAFSFYQSLRTIPIELSEAAESFRLSPWMRFWQLEVPFAMPALIWNMMMSMSGGWFFVVASESISVGHTTVALPGVGSYIALAIEQKNLTAIGWAIATMLIVILLYDQLLFRPLVAWVDRFRVEQEPGARVPDSWALTMMRRSRLIQAATVAFHAA